jgi:zinc protease
MHRKPVSAKFAIALFGVALFAQTLPPGVERKASLGGITEYDFPNGLKVLLYPVASTPSITLNMVYEVGSRHEGYGETGMAHLLEHMNFIETTTGRQVKKELVDHGASWNGSTNADTTDFFETFNASDENLQWALSLETDRMVNIRFTKQILDTEMTVVRNEFERGENDPASILEERVAATAYLWHNYGKSTIGSKEDIERVPVDRLEAFYRKYYRPDNAVAVISGKIDESRTLQFVADTLGRIPRPKTPVEQTYTVEPAQDGERYVELRRVGQNPELIVAYHAVAAAHPDLAALQVLASVMNGTGGGRGGRGGFGGGGSAPEGRLRKALVDTKLAESASMSARAEHDPGLVEFRASLTKDQSLDAARKALFEAIDDVSVHPPTREEVERLKTQMLRGLETQLANPAGLATGALHSAIGEGDWRLLFLSYTRLKDVSPEDLVRVAKAYLKPSNRTVGYYIPDAAPDRTVVPAAPDLGALLKDYKSTLVVVHGEDFDPTPANIESRLARARLADGMKLVALNKKTESDRVSSVIELRFGDESTLKGKRVSAQFADSLLNADTKSHTRQQIQDELRKLDATIIVGGGGGGGGRGGRGGRGGGAGGGSISSVTASVSAPRENFLAAMKLAVEMLKEPLYKDEDFQRALQARIRVVEAPQTEPTQLAAEMLQRRLSPYSKGDPLYSGTREEQAAELKTANLDDIRKFHDQFFGANYGVMAVVGPIDLAVVQKAAEELLGNWNTAMVYKPEIAHYQAGPAPIDTKIETPDKANAQFEAGLRFQMAETDPDYPAMLLAGYMFGVPITSRVSDRIRNREGLSYGANARVTIPAEGDASTLTGTVSLNPAFGPKVEASFVDELQKTVKDGFTAAEVDAGKKAYLDSRRVARGGDAQLLAAILSNELLGRTLMWDAQVEQKIAALTAGQVNAAFRRHIDPAKLSIVKAGDFKAAGVFQ